MTRVVVSGATGFLGSHLVRWLVAEQYDVVALVRARSNLHRLADVVERIHVLRLDDEPLVTVLERLKPVDVLLHTAAIYGRGHMPWADLVETNILLGVRLAQAAVQIGVAHFINVASALSPEVSPYALSKHQLSEWLQRIAQEARMNVVDVALETMYGEGQDEDQFIPRVILACLRNVERLLLTAGEQQRDFIYIEDVAEAFARLIRHYLQNGVTGERYTRYALGSGCAVRIRDVASLIWQMTHSRTRLDFGAVPYRLHEAMFSQADISAWRALGWQPRHGLEAGLRRTIAWWQRCLQEKHCAG